MGAACGTSAASSAGGLSDGSQAGDGNEQLIFSVFSPEPVEATDQNVMSAIAGGKTALVRLGRYPNFNWTFSAEGLPEPRVTVDDRYFGHGTPVYLTESRWPLVGVAAGSYLLEATLDRGGTPFEGFVDKYYICLHVLEPE